MGLWLILGPPLHSEFCPGWVDTQANRGEADVPLHLWPWLSVSHRHQLRRGRVWALALGKGSFAQLLLLLPLGVGFEEGNEA
jgi:hypothetical protein